MKNGALYEAGTSYNAPLFFCPKAFFLKPPAFFPVAHVRINAVFPRACQRRGTGPHVVYGFLQDLVVECCPLLVTLVGDRTICADADIARRLDSVYVRSEEEELPAVF